MTGVDTRDIYASGVYWALDTLLASRTTKVQELPGMSNCHVAAREVAHDHRHQAAAVGRGCSVASTSPILTRCYGLDLLPKATRHGRRRLSAPTAKGISRGRLGISRNPDERRGLLYSRPHGLQRLVAVAMKIPRMTPTASATTSDTSAERLGVKDCNTSITTP